MRTFYLALLLIPGLAQAEGSALPSRAKRVQALEAAGFRAEELSTLDELDQDLLYLRAQTKPESLSELYPNLPLQKLTKLGKSLQEEK